MVTTNAATKTRQLKRFVHRFMDSLRRFGPSKFTFRRTLRRATGATLHDDHMLTGGNTHSHAALSRVNAVAFFNPLARQ